MNSKDRREIDLTRAMEDKNSEDYALAVEEYEQMAARLRKRPYPKPRDEYEEMLMIELSPLWNVGHASEDDEPDPSDQLHPGVS